MLTAGKIAKDWKVNKSYVQRCIKKGCPTDSFENARDWRTANASSRPSTHPKQIAIELEAADIPVGKRRVVQSPKSLDSEDDTLDGALSNAIKANEEAFRILQESITEQRDKVISSRLSVFNKSSENRFKAEQSYREEKERRSVLIELTKAQDWARKAFDVILSRLASLPQNLAVRCNPQNPHTAMDALEEEVKTIISDGQRAISV